jgi:eukaryotic-like serine/threonine-protein kinase
VAEPTYLDVRGVQAAGVGEVKGAMVLNEDPTDIEEISALSASAIETTGVSSSTLDDDERSIGPYRVYRRIASGGMASVYLARREGARGLQKVVAVKRMHAHLARRRDYVEMFLDEVRLVSRVRHPYVASIIDCGDSLGRPYMAMEYVAGESLSAVMARLAERPDLTSSPRFPRLVARLVANLCQGLHAAHEASDEHGRPLGLVHRDINPPNLFMAFDGSVRVIDFGVAQARHRLHQTRTGILKGKIGYMPPEAFRREVLDRRADVWSMGVVLWELLTQRRLFKRSSEIDTITAVCAGDIARPSSINPVVPRVLDAAVATALEATRERRHPTARDLGENLERYLDDCDDVVTDADFSAWLRDLFPASSEHQRKLLSWVQEHSGEGRTGDSVLQAGVERAPSEPLPGPPVHHWPRGFWRTLGVAAALEVLVMVLLASAALRGRVSPRAPIAPVALATAAAVEAPAPAPIGAPPEDEKEPPPPVPPDPPPAFVGPPVPAPAPRPRGRVVAPARRAPARRAVALPVEATEPPLTVPQVSEGQLLITTPGTSAEVRFRDRLIGRTPCYVVLPAGRQRIALTYRDRPGQTPIEVSVPAGGLLTVRATLAPAP